MAKIKVLAGSWKDQVGEFVRNEVDAAERVVAVVARMSGNRLVEFAAEHVEHVADEPAAEPASAE